MGLKVIYDREIRTPRDEKDNESAKRALRLVFLKTNDDYVSELGLLQYLKSKKQPLHQGAEPFSVGSMLMVFNTDNIDSRLALARNTLDVKVLSEPSEIQYQDYKGDDMLKVKVSVIIDPDGNIVELNCRNSDLL